jgi:hypothetical protein
VKTVYLWVRQDGEQPKAIQAGATPPGPGKVVAVEASSSREARELYALSVRAVNEEQDPDGWFETRKAQRRVREVK